MHPRTQEILDNLDRSRRELRAAFDAVLPAMRDRCPAPGRWSPSGIIEHLAIVEARVAGRLSARLAKASAEGIGLESSTTPILPTLGLDQVVNRTTRVMAPELAHPTGMDAEAAWTALESAGVAVRDALRSADGLALATITMEHPAFGPISLYRYFAFIGAHEARHAAQIREIAEALPAAGSAAHNPQELTR